jgi:hypothetical protein
VMKPARAFLAVALFATGCSASRVENGVFHSSKGFQVSLPRQGWAVKEGGAAEIELQRKDPAGGMLADATCDDKTVARPLTVLSRHLTFGMTERVVEYGGEYGGEDGGTFTLAGRPAQRAVVRGRIDGVQVGVEAVVIKGERCVYDFLYVAPAAAFETGRGDFRAFVESFNGGAR